MSNSDKTRKKLMGTTRATKAVSSKGVENIDATQTITPQDDKPIMKKKKNTETKAKKDSKKLSVDLYQAARRVWPD